MSECKHGLRQGCSYCHASAKSAPSAPPIQAGPKRRSRPTKLQEQMNDQLYHDLSTDRNMSWVQRNSWLTYLSLDAPSSTVTYDLGVNSSGVIRLAPFGTAPMAVVDGPTARIHDMPSWLPTLPLGTPENVLLGVLFIALASSASWWIIRTRKQIREDTPANL